MRRILNYCTRRLVFLIALCVLVASAYVLAGRLLITYVSQYKDDILTKIEQSSGLHADAQQITGSWSWFMPVITLTDLRLNENREGTSSVIRAKKIQFRVDVLASVLTQEPRLADLHVDGLALVVDCDSQGRYRIPGLHLQASTSNQSGLLPLILKQQLLRLTHSQLTVQIEGQSPLIIRDLNIQLKRLSSFYQLEASTTLGDQQLRVLINANGNPLQKQNSQVNVYAHLDEGNILQWLPVSLLRILESKSQLKITQWRGGTEFWGHWKQGQLSQLRGVVTNDVLKIEQQTTQQQIEINDLHSQFQLNGNQQDSFVLQLADFQFVLGKHVWPNSQLKARFNTKRQSLDLQMDKGLISPLVDLLLFSGAAPKDALEDMLRTLEMKGLFRHLSVHAEIKDPSAFVLSTELASLRFNAWRNIPAARGLSGLVRVTPGTGTFLLDAKRVHLDLDKYFRQALTLDRIQGPLSWRINEDNISVQSGEWTASNDDVQAHAVFSVRVPRHQNNSAPSMVVSGAESLARPETVPVPVGPAPELFLLAQFQHINGARLSRYLPPQLPEKTLDWLDKALLAGDLNGRFLYHGSLRWKDEPLQHTLQAEVAFKNATVDYHPKLWPQVTAATGTVFIDDANVGFTVSEGKIWSSDISVQEGFVGHTALWPLTHLQLHGQVRGDMRDALRLLQDTPLNDMLKGSAKNWKGRGEVSAEMTLSLPLVPEARKMALDVKTHFHKTTFALTPYDLTLGALQGELNYTTKDGLFAEELKASLFGYPAILHIPRNKAQDNALFRLSLDSAISLKTLTDWSHQPILAFTDGVIEYHADLDITNTTPVTTQVEISTSAEGMAIQLPPPFAKLKNQARSTTFKLISQGDRSDYTLQQDRVFSSRFSVLKEKGLQNLQLLVGENQSFPVERSGVVLSGTFPTLDWAQWQVVLKKLTDDYQQKQPQVASGSSSGKEITSTAFVDTIRRIDLEIGAFDGFGLHLDNLVAQVTRKGNAWAIQASNTMLKGQVVVPDASQHPIVLALDYFRYQEKKQDASGAELKPLKPSVSKSLVTMLPRDFPALTGEIDDVQINNWKLGRWKFSAKPVGDRYQISDLNIMLADQVLSARGTWHPSTTGQTVTELVGESKGKDIGKLMSLWGQAPTLVSKKTVLSFNVSWPYSPFDFSASKVSGKMELMVKDGRFLDVGAASALRVLGILNFSELGRRLRLDFGDLVKGGHSFDRISGPLYVEQGVLDLQRLEINSPSANMVMVGEMDFIQDTLDLDLNVELQLTKNLVSIAAIMGGPAAGGGMYVIDRLIGERIEKFASLKYQITGTPQKPDIRLKAL